MESNVCTLITDPKLVLFDPSSGLMPKYVDEIFKKITEIQEERGISFLFLEQHVNTLFENSDRTYVIRDGSVRFNAESRKLLEKKDLGGSQAEGVGD